MEFPRPSDQFCEDLFEISLPFLRDHAERLKIESISTGFFQDIVIPLGVYLNLLPQKEKPYLICFSGGQGSGKTTLSHFLQLLLRKAYGRSALGFSIDDLYKTKEDRKRLAKDIHPLCEVRGVPGTHDIPVGLKVLDSLFSARPSTLTPIPAFSKPLDERKPQSAWQVYEGRPDYIFFDAWFGGAKPLPGKDWKPPMNLLELKEDPDGLWSKWSNKELAGDYQRLFNRFDLLLMIKLPNMDDIYHSRWLQEQTLAKTLTDAELHKKIMTRKEVEHFVMHYERLTHYVQEKIPDIADFVITRDKRFNYRFSKVPE
tara:strand:+ start:338 stop:1279 length:942 start_codon:yes stop_codon:yes gene_type:complete